MGLDLHKTNTFTTTVNCQLPGEGKDTVRDFKFTATFEIIDSEEWDEILENSTRSEALRKVLKEVGDEVNEYSGEDDFGNPIKLSREEVVIRHAMTCDAAFMDYHLYITKNSRSKAIQASESKNSKRSRKR